MEDKNEFTEDIKENRFKKGAGLIPTIIQDFIQGKF